MLDSVLTPLSGAWIRLLRAAQRPLPKGTFQDVSDFINLISGLKKHQDLETE